MDKYEHWLGRLFGFLNSRDNYAITLGQTTYYSCPERIVDFFPHWRKEEDIHKQQWKRDGIFCFTFKYIYYNIRYGYDKNPYELEAKEKS